MSMLVWQTGVKPSGTGEVTHTHLYYCKLLSIGHLCIYTHHYHAALSVQFIHIIRQSTKAYDNIR